MENIKHLSKKDLEVIRDCSSKMASLEKGVRQMQKAKANFAIVNASKYSRHVKTLPSKFSIMYIYTANLGNKKYCDNYFQYAFSTYDKKRGDTLRETEKSFIIESKYGKTVIRKEKILCFVW